MVLYANFKIFFNICFTDAGTNWRHPFGSKPAQAW
ncbi:hypothetical protein KL86DES1_21314 [uncultured Desulfovibrio sp.]|uniref:Uncharacterized protein n=1 Tax=uncultured Desulfovibrio sp. TaxID=167968 RepID=A0A212L7B0_9BACT|nr:hypothetical protein KL86DES1_21314 [uncultured Desulfovibrio sp.]VZH34212.1 conserved protein of unknown function [Desulfovibrio sp. 86]